MAKRRWYQFTLRSTAVILTITALACGLFSAHILKYRREMLTAVELQNAGVEVVYLPDWSWSNRVFGMEQRRPHQVTTQKPGDSSVQVQRVSIPRSGQAPLPTDFPTLIRHMHRVEIVDLSHSDCDDETLGRLQHLDNLTQLNLRDTQVTDEGVRLLATFEKLRRLELGLTRVTSLSNDFSQLQTLILHDTPVDDRGLAQILSHCPAIVHLDVANTKITDEALSATRFPPSLKTLNLGDGVSLEAADRLAAQLPRVSISFNGITIVTVRARRAFIARLRASGFGGGGSRRGSSTRSPTNSDTSSPTSSPINSGTSSRTNSGTSYRGLGRRVGND